MGVGVGTCGVGNGVVAGGLMFSVTNRSATISTVPNAPLWLSTPPQVIWEPGVELATIVTLVLIAYLPSAFGAWLNVMVPPVTNINLLEGGAGIPLMNS